ncbi:MAG: hypothetical protein QXM43_01205 [Desulfurococcaceae archaeon]
MFYLFLKNFYNPYYGITIPRKLKKALLASIRASKLALRDYKILRSKLDSIAASTTYCKKTVLPWIPRRVMERIGIKPELRKVLKR